MLRQISRSNKQFYRIGINFCIFNDLFIIVIFLLLIKRISKIITATKLVDIPFIISTSPIEMLKNTLGTIIIHYKYHLIQAKLIPDIWQKRI